MKKNTNFIIWIAVGITVLLYGCVKNIIHDAPTTNAIILIDVTDAVVAKIEVDKIFAELQIAKHPYEGINITIAPISDMRVNQERHINMPATNYYNGNENVRKEDAEKLQQEVAQKTNDITANPYRSQSKILTNVIHYANLLSQSEAEKKVMFIYSDLIENSSQANLYRGYDKSLLLNDPEAYIKNLGDLKINDLTGITIIIIHQPKDTNEDEIYQALSEVYQKIFSEKGAAVEFKANL